MISQLKSVENGISIGVQCANPPNIVSSSPIVSVTLIEAKNCV
jgi:hypothetical protein